MVIKAVKQKSMLYLIPGFIAAYQDNNASLFIFVINTVEESMLKSLFEQDLSAE